jgi:flagellar hook-associated protein 2
MGFAEIRAGANADITVDGVTITPSSNTVDDVITGVTLNLKKAALDTTVTLSVSRDYAKVKETISGFVTAYNDLIDAVNAQSSYNSDNQKTGGPLFGDSTLRSIKSSLTDLIINRVSGVDGNFSTLGLVGIKIGNDSKLTIDDGDLQDYLETNFDDVKRLFAADWSSTNSNLIYGYHTIDTKAGTYNINISGVNPVAGYFVTPGDATGDGEYLTGVSGDAKGLMIRYSGTATGAVGSFTLSYGVAELIDRALYHVTDSVDGTISNKTETIQDQIENLNESISDLEDRIDQKMARLERQFIAMEIALSALQSQSSWLSGQLNAANSGWR